MANPASRLCLKTREILQCSGQTRSPLSPQACPQPRQTRYQPTQLPRRFSPVATADNIAVSLGQAIRVLKPRVGMTWWKINLMFSCYESFLLLYLNRASANQNWPKKTSVASGG